MICDVISDSCHWYVYTSHVVECKAVFKKSSFMADEVIVLDIYFQSSAPLSLCMSRLLVLFVQEVCKYTLCTLHNSACICLHAYLYMHTHNIICKHIILAYYTLCTHTCIHGLLTPCNYSIIIRLPLTPDVNCYVSSSQGHLRR